MPIGKHYYWDACVFISVLTLKDRTPEELIDLKTLEALSDDGKITILTSAITKIEVLECLLTPEQETMFQEMLQRSSIEVVSLNSRIAKIAREIRNYYLGKMAVPDSIHVATALFYGSTALHTYDGCGKKKKHTDLLKLERPIAGKYDLSITKPTPPPSEKPDPTPVIVVTPATGNLFDQLEEEENGEDIEGEVEEDAEQIEEG